jgi:hypothetical protein
MTITTDRTVQAAIDPRGLVSPETYDKSADFLVLREAPHAQYVDRPAQRGQGHHPEAHR